MHLVKKVPHRGQTNHNVTQLAERSSGLLVLRLGLLQLLRVNYQSLLHSYLSVVVHVARRRVCSRSADHDLFLASFALLELLLNFELRAHERLTDQLKSYLFALESPLL